MSVKLLSPRALQRTLLSLSGLAFAVLSCSGVIVSPAVAVSSSPGWQIVTIASPTAFTYGANQKNSYVLVVSNVGGAPTNGGTITLTDVLPPGMRGEVDHSSYADDWNCEGGNASGSVISCASSKTVGVMGQLSPLRVSVYLSTPADSELTNSVTVAGGGAPPVSAASTMEVNPSVPLSFGVADLTSFLTDFSGAPDTQAADHPNGLTTSFGVNSVFEGGQEGLRPVQNWRDIVVDLPPGVVGNPQVAVQCPLTQLYLEGGEAVRPDLSACPAGSQVGTLGIRQGGSGEVGGPTDGIRIYNMVPEHNTPAEFAFTYLGDPLGIYPTVVGQGAAAHIRVQTPGIPASAFLHIMANYVKFFGDPAAADGDPEAPNAFFTNSSDCDGGPLVTELHVDSYEDPGSWTADSSSTQGAPNVTDGVPDFSDPAWKSKTYSSPPVTGCEKLHFDPSLAVQPETTKADEPSGLAVDLSVPQNPDPHGLATPPFKNVTVTLPAGMSLSPSAADGLQACTAEQFDLESNTESSCPDASVLGTAKVSTPLLGEPLTGYVFLAEPECDPCSNQDASDGRMLKLYLQVEGAGIVQKAPGTIYVNATTGQLTTKFLENPQFPISDVQFAFKGGLRAGLATPQTCGTFTATSDMTPWSTPYTPDATPSSSFDVSWDGAGGVCPASPPLTPSFSAGTSNPNAGQFSPFTLTFAREDRQQDLSGIQVKMPPGLLGSLTGVPLCGEEQANAGTCSLASRIGTMTVAAGPGGTRSTPRGRSTSPNTTTARRSG